MSHRKKQIKSKGRTLTDLMGWGDAAFSIRCTIFDTDCNFPMWPGLNGAKMSRTCGKVRCKEKAYGLPTTP